GRAVRAGALGDVELAHALVELAHRARQQYALSDIAGHDAGDPRNVVESRAAEDDAVLTSKSVATRSPPGRRACSAPCLGRAVTRVHGSTFKGVFAAFFLVSDSEPQSRLCSPELDRDGVRPRSGRVRAAGERGLHAECSEAIVGELRQDLDPGGERER